MTDFTVPQRMSANAFVIILVKKFYNIAGIFIVYFLASVYESSTGADIWIKSLASLATLISLVVLATCASYFPKRFYVKDGNLIFRHGLIHRETTTIPLDKIHTLRTHRGIVYRLLEMRGISFDTLASKGEEIELILDEADWQSLISLIEKEESLEKEVTGESIETKENDEFNFSNRKLIFDTLCQNHLKGMAVLGGFLAVIYNRVSELYDDAVKTIIDQTEVYLENTEIPLWVIVSMLAGVYLLVLLLWFGKVTLRYYNTSLLRSKKLLTFNYGLLSRSSCRFAYNKICTIWVKRNFLEKRFGLATVMLRQALLASAKKEEDNLKLYGGNTSEMFLKWWLGEEYAASPDIIEAKSGKGAALPIIVPAFVLSTAVSVILWYFYLNVWITVPVIYLLIEIFQGLSAMKRSRIILKRDYIIVDNGRFADIRNYLKYENIEVVKIIGTPLTPYFHRVTLALSTPGTTFKIRSLKEEDVRMIYRHFEL